MHLQASPTHNPAAAAAFAGLLVTLASCVLDSGGRLSESSGAGATTTASTGQAGDGGAATSTGGQIAAGGQGGSGATAGAGGGGGVGGPPQTYRRRIAVTATTPVPASYSLSLQLDHGALVNAGKSLATGDDLRVWRDDGGSWTELPRVLDPAAVWNDVATTIWFRSTTAVAGGGTDDSYYLYYGDPTSPAPSHDGSQVYDFWLAGKHDDIFAYCKRDVEVNRQIYKRLIFAPDSIPANPEQIPAKESPSAQAAQQPSLLEDA